MYTSSDLTWDLMVAFAHVQIYKCRRLCGNGRTHVFLPYVCFINEGHWLLLRQSCCNFILPVHYGKRHGCAQVRAIVAQATARLPLVTKLPIWRECLLFKFFLLLCLHQCKMPIIGEVTVFKQIKLPYNSNFFFNTQKVILFWQRQRCPLSLVTWL